MDRVAIIPAKGRSRRLPNKNKIYFYGEPMVVRAARACHESGMFDEIVVSTDDETIMDLIADMNLDNVSFLARETALCGDDVTVNEVILDILPLFKDYDLGYFCCVYPCSPLILPEDIVKSYRLMVETEAEGCCSMTSYQVSPAYVFRVVERKVNALFESDYARGLAKGVLYHDTGNIYWRKTSSFLRERELMGSNMAAYELPRERAVDIDTPDDLRLAEYYYGKRE